MDRFEAFLMAAGAFILGALIATVLLIKPLTRSSIRVMDLEAQLAICDSGREVIHHQLHIMSDSVLLLERRSR